MIRDDRPMQPRPRVLAVAQSADLGGAERALIRLARRLPELGIDVEIATPAGGPAADQAALQVRRRALDGAVDQAARPAPRLPVGGLRAGAWPRAIAAWPRARRMAGEFDAVLLNGIVTQRLAPAMTATTLVPYIHELSESQPRAWRTRRFWSATPIVLCACDAVAQRCRALGAPGDRLRTVYAPVETVEPAPRPSWADGPVVGFVGRVEPHKGALDLVRAMRGVDATLVMAGDGDGRYADQVRSEAGERMRMLGPVDDARSLMPWFDLLVVPSYNEAFGTVAAEALAAGTPVVATRGGGIEEYVAPGRNGDLVMPGDIDALAAAIRRLLPRAATMAEAAREDARRFDADTVAATVADLLGEAIARRR
jgi:glycosyltransferase involved in cell wall biosynthesis